MMTLARKGLIVYCILFLHHRIVSGIYVMAEGLKIV